MWNKLTFTGPLKTTRKTDICSVALSTGKHMTLAVAVTKPAVEELNPLPLLVFINGFQAQASQYYDFVDQLASWGFVVVQYSTPRYTFVQDCDELLFLPQLLEWTRIRSDMPSGFLQNAVDWNQICLVGHSRGGKLAALHLTHQCDCNPSLCTHTLQTAKNKCAFLIDPVDNTSQTPEGPIWPSACTALRKAGLPVAVLGAGVVGRLNPEGSNWRQFWEAAGEGSWLMVLPQAGHVQFLVNTSLPLKWVLNGLFNTGPMTRQAIINAVVPLILQWIRKHLDLAPTHPLCSTTSPTSAPIAVPTSPKSPKFPKSPKSSKSPISTPFRKSSSFQALEPESADSADALDSSKRGGIAGLGAEITSSLRRGGSGGSSGLLASANRKSYSKFIDEDSPAPAPDGHAITCSPPHSPSDPDSAVKSPGSGAKRSGSGEVMQNASVLPFSPSTDRLETLDESAAQPGGVERKGSPVRVGDAPVAAVQDAGQQGGKEVGVLAAGAPASNGGVCTVTTGAGGSGGLTTPAAAVDLLSFTALQGLDFDEWVKIRADEGVLLYQTK